MTTPSPDILIVEDNLELAELLRDFIERAGYSCEQVTSGEAALRFVDSHDVGIVVLDIMLPGIDGFAVCDAIHKSKNTPIVILSARTEKDDKLNALLLGADDYLEKPYDIDLLIAKIQALYRRHYEDPSAALLEFGPLTIDQQSRVVHLADKALPLTAKEYELLLLLAQNKGKALRKEFIFDRIWGVDSFSEPSTLTVHIKWLREKIEVDQKNPRFIHTIWGVGYRFEYTPGENA